MQPLLVSNRAGQQAGSVGQILNHLPRQSLPIPSAAARGPIRE
jgi:hypothetical protein